MVGIANILALSKLTSDTPDAVRKAATLMIVGGGKNALISGIASANIVEEATNSAVEATSAKAATAKAEEAKSVAETKTVELEAEIATIRPLVTAVANKVLTVEKAATTDGTQVDGYTRMIAALKAGTTVESVMSDLAKQADDDGDDT